MFLYDHRKNRAEIQILCWFSTHFLGEKKKTPHFKKFLANIWQKGSALSKNFRRFFSIVRTISPWCGIVQTLQLSLDLHKKFMELMGSYGKKSYLTLYASLCYEIPLFCFKKVQNRVDTNVIFSMKNIS